MKATLILIQSDAEHAQAKALVEKLLIYAQGRGLEYADDRAVREICANVERQGDRFSGVILAIVESDLFQKRQAKEDLNIQAKGE
jgi:hypothetical protein